MIVSDAELGLDARTGQVTIAAGRAVATGVDGPSFGAEEVGVEGLRGGLVAALRFGTSTAERVSPQTGRYETGRVYARQVRFGPLGAPDEAGTRLANTVGNVEITGLRGEVEPVRAGEDQPVTGWRLRNTFATSMTLDNLSYQGGAAPAVSRCGW